MKVICIDSSPGINTGEIPPFKEGEILTAENRDDIPNRYWIIEYPDHSWKKSRFIPISEIDELELAEQRLVTA